MTQSARQTAAGALDFRIVLERSSCDILSSFVCQLRLEFEYQPGVGSAAGVSGAIELAARSDQTALRIRAVISSSEAVKNLDRAFRSHTEHRSAPARAC